MMVAGGSSTSVKRSAVSHFVRLFRAVAPPKICAGLPLGQREPSMVSKTQPFDFQHSDLLLGARWTPGQFSMVRNQRFKYVLHLWKVLSWYFR